MGGTGSGRPKKPLEQRAVAAKGDGRDAGHRKLNTPPGMEIAMPGNQGGDIAFPHDKLEPAPEYLNDVGIACWYKIWDNSPWMHPKRDHMPVAIIAQCVQNIHEWMKIVDSAGPTVLGRNDELVQHPLILAIRQAQSMILKASGQLGIGPSARAALHLADLQAKTTLADLQKRSSQKPDLSYDYEADSTETPEPDDIVDADVITGEDFA